MCSYIMNLYFIELAYFNKLEYCEYARWLPLLEDLDVCGTKSWGSAVLAYLYREMSKVALIQNSELKGCLSLLQVWAWERLHLKPRLCTHLQLDGQIPLGCRYCIFYIANITVVIIVVLNYDQHFFVDGMSKNIMTRPRLDN